MPDSIRVVTVADWRFLRPALHLRNSLRTSGNLHHLTIYCDDAKAFAGLQGETCTVKQWAPMKRLGAKRSKPGVFADAIAGGGFLYLDADAIVLGPMGGFKDDAALCGSFDDLSQCDYIKTPRFP